ncbi:MAG: alanine racemase [Chloroflexi bacterium]|nr:alanine racemase [Chloroflexota bacterium]
MDPNDIYLRYRDIFRGQRLPLAFIDLDKFDVNVAYVAEIARSAGKTIRLGTKSIRCLELMRRILAAAPEIYRGLLTFTVEETAWLASQGFDDMIIAYPSVQPGDISLLLDLTRAGKQVWLMVDSIEHIRVLSAAGHAAGLVLHACLEVDMAYRPLDLSSVHLGLRRSPVRTPEQARNLIRAAKKYEGVAVDALMGYEGHIAGMNDDVPGAGLKNSLMRAIKKDSVRELTIRRDKIVESLRAEGAEFRVINGGGSGSLVSTGKDPLVTEITVGSGFYASGLFHHYKEVHFEPSAFFAIQIVRIPTQGMVTCLGGGYIASGAIGPEKLPLPVYPIGLSYLSLEGAGEVQTPFILPENCPELGLGDPIFLQHAKAGELCERFNDLWLVENGRLSGQVRTYRGEGMAFL